VTAHGLTAIEHGLQRCEVCGLLSRPVFVDTFTAALIQLQPLMSVEPGPGLVFFAAVVVFTMLGVESFDPRLIWDGAAQQEVAHA